MPKAIRYLNAKNLWDDYSQQIRYAYFYSPFKKKFSYFFLIIHFQTAVAVGIVEVVLYASPRGMAIANGIIITAYIAAIFISRPYQAMADNMFDIALGFVDMFGVVLNLYVVSQEVSEAEGGNEDFGGRRRASKGGGGAGADSVARISFGS